MVKYVPKRRSLSGLTKTPHEETSSENEIGLLGNLEVRKAVYSFLCDEVGKPASTRSEDLVPLLVEALGEEPPSEYCDDIQDAYCWAALTAIDRGLFAPSAMALNGWMTQSRVKLVRACMSQSKASSAFKRRKAEKVTKQVLDVEDDE